MLKLALVAAVAAVLTVSAQAQSIYGSDSNGNTWNATRIGNQTIINRSDGSMTTCTRIGNQSFCN